jgi:hypothetical protein
MFKIKEDLLNFEERAGRVESNWIVIIKGKWVVEKMYVHSDDMVQK